MLPINQKIYMERFGLDEVLSRYVSIVTECLKASDIH